MKVKITKDDGVKIKLTREEAAHLRSLLIEAPAVRELRDISEKTKTICGELDTMLAGEDVWYRV